MINPHQSVQLVKFWLSQNNPNPAKALLVEILKQTPFDLSALELLSSVWPEEAVTLISQLAATPNCPPSVKCILAELHLEGNNPKASIDLYNSVLNLIDPQFEVFHNLGLAHAKLFQFKEAVEQFEKAYELNAESFELHLNWGAALANLGLNQESLQHLYISEKIIPNDPRVWLNIGVTLEQMNQHEQALHCFERALELNPNYLEAHSNKANSLFTMGRYDESLAAHQRALLLDPNDPVTLFNLGSLQLRLGDYELGWKNYESRWALERVIEKPYGNVPALTDLDNLVEKNIFVWSEQGLGDSIQFCRFVPLLANFGARTTLLVQKPLTELLKNLSGIEKVISLDETAVGQYHFQISMMSLPYLFHKSGIAFPYKTPYIKPNPLKISFWKERLLHIHALKVGLVWNGGFRQDQPKTWVLNGRRNIPFEVISQLRKISGVHFFSLQKGEPAESELLSKRNLIWPEKNLSIFGAELLTFEDTAALIENLDLVISVDTSTAHLTGALNKPLWILNRFDSCWRWGSGKEKTDWYPSARIFNQPSLGDWESVIGNVKEELSKHVSNICGAI